MASYEQALRLLRYRNWHTRSLLGRKFKLVCSELSGRYVSNEFQVEVSVGPSRAALTTLPSLLLRLAQPCPHSCPSRWHCCLRGAFAARGLSAP